MIPFVGPSYTLTTRKAQAQRTVNLYLASMEAQGKAAYILEGVPGLVKKASLGSEIRGFCDNGERCFVVAGATLYEIHEDYTTTNRGSLVTISGSVGMCIGLTQLVIVDGANGYTLTLSDNTFGQITDGDFPGADTVDFLDNYFILTRDRDGQQFTWTAINDATAIEALDFASSESLPDDLVSHITLGNEVLMFGTRSVEPHYHADNSDQPFQRNRGSSIEVGLMARRSLRKVDGGAIFLGQDADGSGMVYTLRGYQRQRVSTQAVEESLSRSTDLTQAVAYSYQQNGRTFYCLNAPGVDTTWCYEFSTGTWHERCDIDGFGQYIAHRVTHAVYAFGHHLAGDADGNLYLMDRDTFTFDGDQIVYERTSPHEAMPSLDRQAFAEFVLDASTGETTDESLSPLVELSWSNDGGRTFGDPVTRSLGRTGEYFSRMVWRRLGMARDRVWRVRFSGKAPFSIISANAR